jgi:protein-S-isoprenylcysteine O-methyltransferase Ste14
MEKIFIFIYLVPLLWRNNFDLKPKKNLEEFRVSTGAWMSLIVWTIGYLVAAPLALYHAWNTTPGFLAGIGWLTLFFGIVLRRLAHRELGIYYHPSIGVRSSHQVVNVGVYRYLRHPLHLGLFLEISGWCLMSESPIGAGVFLVTLVTTLLRNHSEEKYLTKELGDVYVTYRNQTWDIIRPWKFG